MYPLLLAINFDLLIGFSSVFIHLNEYFVNWFRLLEACTNKRSVFPCIVLFTYRPIYSYWGARFHRFSIACWSFVVPIMLFVERTKQKQKPKTRWFVVASNKIYTRGPIMVRWHWNASKWIVRSTNNNMRASAGNSIQASDRVCLCAHSIWAQPIQTLASQLTILNAMPSTRHIVLGHFQISGYPHSLISWYYIILSKARSFSNATMHRMWSVCASVCRIEIYWPRSMFQIA